MKIRIRLLGVLNKGSPDHSPDESIEIEIPDGATSADLLAYLGISESQMAVVTCEGRVLKPENALHDDSNICVFQAVFGG